MNINWLRVCCLAIIFVFSVIASAALADHVAPKMGHQWPWILCAALVVPRVRLRQIQFEHTAFFAIAAIAGTWCGIFGTMA
jgi:hypothetical protein